MFKLMALRNIYILLTEREVRMGEYWLSSLFTCLWTEPHHTHLKRERDQYSPIRPSARSINGLLIGFKLVWTLSLLINYKSKQSQEETTAVQCTRKQTTWGNSDSLTFSKAKIRLGGKLRKRKSVQKIQMSVRLLYSKDTKVRVKRLLKQRRSVNFRDIQTFVSGFNMRVFTLMLRNYLNFLEVWPSLSSQTVWSVLLNWIMLSLLIVDFNFLEEIEGFQRFSVASSVKF